MARLGEVGEELVLAVSPADALPDRFHGHALVESLDDRYQRKDEALHHRKRGGGLLLGGRVRVVGERRVHLPVQVVLDAPVRPGGKREKPDVVEGKQVVGAFRPGFPGDVVDASPLDHPEGPQPVPFRGFGLPSDLRRRPVRPRLGRPVGLLDGLGHPPASFQFPKELRLGEVEGDVLQHPGPVRLEGEAIVAPVAHDRLGQFGLRVEGVDGDDLPAYVQFPAQFLRDGDLVRLVGYRLRP